MSNNDNQQNTIKLVSDFNINTLPHDNEAEEVLLGSLLSDNTLDLIENGLSDTIFCSHVWTNLSKYMRIGK